MNNTFYVYSPSLSHHGIKGQRWGVRRYQNPDGTLTAAGRRRVKKAMKQHEKVMMSGSSKRKQRKEYNKFKKMTLAMTDSEVKSLIENLQKDSAISGLTDTSFKDVKNKDGSKFIENGLKYAEQTARIISTISAMKNAQEINKYSVAAKKADILKAQATARSTNANAEGKEFENLKNRTEWEESRKKTSPTGNTWYTLNNPKKTSPTGNIRYTVHNPTKKTGGPGVQTQQYVYNTPSPSSNRISGYISSGNSTIKAISASSGVNKMALGSGGKVSGYISSGRAAMSLPSVSSASSQLMLPTVSSASTNRALPTVTNSNYMLPRKT